MPNNQSQKKNTWKILIVVSLMIGMLGVAQPWIGIFNRNLTGSLPQKLFWTSFFNKDVQKGGLVTFYSNLEGLENDMLIKIVGGVAGDVVTVKDEQVYINGGLIGSFHKTLYKGKAITPTNNKVIPQGKIFVYTTHPKSFDSRYEEMGLIDEKQILGRAYVVL